MKNISDKIFLCYAWENSAAVKRAVSELEYDLGARISSDTEFTATIFEASDDVLRRVENSEVFLLFLSDISKDVNYVKQCVVRAQNVNKRILPVEIDKCGSLPAEFNFRNQPYDYSNQKDRGELAGQMRAMLGFDVESGDGFGSLIHIKTDMDAYVMREGEKLETLQAGKDGSIRLKKGTHSLEFVAVENFEVQHTVKYKVNSNDGEQFLQVSLVDIYNKVQQQAEIKRVGMEKELERQRKSAAGKKNGSNIGKIIMGVLIVFLVLVILLVAVNECGGDSNEVYTVSEYEEMMRESGKVYEEEMKELEKDYEETMKKSREESTMVIEPEDDYDEMLKEAEAEYEEMLKEAEREYEELMKQSEREYEELMRGIEW